MQNTLKLTITAVGEPDSIFLVPCEPITLYESEADDRDVPLFDEAGDAPASERDRSAFADPAEALASLASPQVMILADTPPLPRDRRRAS